jgi:hypothetical protein
VLSLNVVVPHQWSAQQARGLAMDGDGVATAMAFRQAAMLK